jgi:hypothetical protein
LIDTLDVLPELGEELGVEVDDVQALKAEQILRPSAATGPDLQADPIRPHVRRDESFADESQRWHLLDLAPLGSIDRASLDLSFHGPGQPNR